LGTNIEAAFWVAPDEIVTGSKEPFEIKIWNLDSNRIESFPIAPGSVSGEVNFSYHPVSRILVSRILVAGMPHADSEEMTVIRWDVDTRREVSSIVLPAKRSILSQDGKRFASHDWTSVDVYDLTNGDHLASFEFSTKGGIQGMALSPDGKQLAVATRDDPKIMIWDVDTRQLVTTLNGHNLVILSLAYSHDGTRLLSSALGGEPMKLWDTRIWEEVSRFEPRLKNFVFRPQFLSDGSTIKAREVPYGKGPDDASFRLWRAPTWEEIAEAEAKGSWQ
jgi:WD40 repeat protein